MNKLRKNINKFYKKYDISDLGNTTKLTKDDMYDLNKLMTAYEAIWLTLDHYEDHTACKFMVNLYGELRDYMDNIPTRPKHNYKPLLKTASAILATITIFTIGMHIGRQHTIKNAILIQSTDTEYMIDFDGEIHEYNHLVSIEEVE